MRKIFLCSFYVLALLVLAVPVLAVQIQNPDPRIFAEIGDNSVLAVLNFAITEIFLPLVGIIAILFIIIGGFQYVTSRGNEEQAEIAKKTLTNAIIGLIVVVLSYIIVTIVINALKGRV